jgi:superfamily II DNA or RNA helicase
MTPAVSTLSPNDITLTWKDTLSLLQEEVVEESVVREGLRIPQLGAYYRVLSHWSVTSDHAIIVLPTGVGKTDTMITIMVGCMCKRILIVVPSKALRNQIAKRFSEFGVLKKYGLINQSAKEPIVRIQKKLFKTLDEIDSICESCNIIIATASLFASFPEGHLERLSANCSHLFLDEAHHAQAPKTWAKIQKAFRTKPSLLFTATPFRNDEKSLQSEIIYNYPLSKAQREKYFTKIEQHPVTTYDQTMADEAIADKAVELLEADLPKFPKHLIMARANNINHAESIYELYRRKYGKYNPVLVHSNISDKKRRENQELFETGKSKIAVCVDMFGEGYDLPEIKIGAFHDMRRNITTALQLIGRFTRHRADLGNAKFVYNSVEDNSSKEILKLISDDSDWNILIPDLSEGKTKKQQDLDKFIRSFELPNTLPLKSIRAAFSFVVYSSTEKQWHPDKYKEYFNEDDFVSIKDLSNRQNTIIIVAAQRIPLAWMKGSEYFNVEHHLYILHWIKESQLLLIHSSQTGRNYYKDLARAVLSTNNLSLIHGENVYRSLHKVERIRFHGIGLTEPFGKNVSYVHRNGSNVVHGTSVTDLFNRSKRVLQGTGYKLGDYVNFGMTSKGRIWSFKRENINELIKWGRELANNLIDDSIKTEQLIKHVALPKMVVDRPNLRPFTIEWPDSIYQEALSFVLIDEMDRHIYLNDCSLQLYQPSVTGNISFKVLGENFESIFSIIIKKEGYDIKHVHGSKVYVGHSKRSLLEVWFNENPPTIYFVDGSFLIDGNEYTILGENLRRFDFEKIRTIDWVGNGVNIRTESEGIDRNNTDSIQYFLIEHLLQRNYDIIFNDDDKDETADIVAMRVDDTVNQLFLELYHCKFSEKNNIGCRLGDLYEVLGQSQKNIRWLDNASMFIEQLIIREKKINTKRSSTRLRKGTLTDLTIVNKKVKHEYSVSLKVFAVQPGLSKAKFEERSEDSNEVERLFAVTEDYIKATKQGEFYVICSP